VGVCSHFELEGERREPALATLRKMARGVFANNLFLYHEIEPLVEAPVFYTPNGVDTGFYRPRCETYPSNPGETLLPDKRNGFSAKLKARLSSISNFVRESSRTGKDERAAQSELRVGWDGSLSNQGPDQ